MLFAPDAGYAHSRCQAINDEFGQRTVIFMREDSGGGPSSCRMIGWKRCATFEEKSLACSLEGALAPGNQFDGLGSHEGVDDRFAHEETRFSLSLIVGMKAPEIHSAGDASEGRYASQANILKGVHAA